mmetsp:Transcript_48676/g.115697  ORF Transcript_48676/g.115697 Transcript_48676/m.115697 type:complete len:211 (-) Transcript_48676:66-698(-)
MAGRIPFVGGLLGAGVAAGSAAWYRSQGTNRGAMCAKAGDTPAHFDADTGSSKETSRILAEARSVTNGTPWAILCTLGPDGSPRCRAVQPAPPEQGFRSICIGTNPLTRKVKECAEDPRVSLTYLSGAGSCVAITGNLSALTSKEDRATRWRDEWSLFYPDGPGKGFLPLELRPTRVEVVSPMGGVETDREDWLPKAVVLRRDGTWEAEK